MTRSLTSKLHLKQRLYFQHMSEGEEHLTMFKDIVIDLQTLEVKYEDEDLGLILLCSMPSSYAIFRDTILYSRDTLTLDEVYDVLFSNEKMKQLVVGSESQAEGLFVRGRPQERFSGDEHRVRSKSKNESRNAEKTCNYCKKKGHIKTECYKLQNKKKRMAGKQGKQQEKSGEAGVVETDHSDGEFLVASDGDSKAGQDWILDYGCTFHMTPNRDWFSTYDWCLKVLC